MILSGNSKGSKRSVERQSAFTINEKNLSSSPLPILGKDSDLESDQDFRDSKIEVDSTQNIIKINAR